MGGIYRWRALTIPAKLPRWTKPKRAVEQVVLVGASQLRLFDK